MAEYPAVMRVTSDNATGDLPIQEQEVWTFDGTVSDGWNFVSTDPLPSGFQMPEHCTIEIWMTIPGYDIAQYSYMVQPNPARHARHVADARARLEALAEHYIIPPELMDDPLLINDWPSFERRAPYEGDAS